MSQVQEVAPLSDSDPLHQMNVVVLDDSEVDRKRLIRLCSEAGLNFEATEVASISEMEHALREKDYDVVFIDYLLAGEDGLGAVDALARLESQSAVSIMIAGEGRIDIAVEAMRRGCSDYMTKSKLTVETIQKSVSTAFERRMMTLSLMEERERRKHLEMAIRRYAGSCSAEMRSILAGTLRRVRRLRSQKLSIEYGEQLGDLEKSIDRLWDALPQFEADTNRVIESTYKPAHVAVDSPMIKGTAEPARLNTS
ncbi:MAG: response regulator [Pseudomonadota bacterium]